MIEWVINNQVSILEVNKLVVWVFLIFILGDMFLKASAEYEDVE